MLIGFLHLLLALVCFAAAAISTGIIQLVVTILFVILICSGTYRITLPVGLKIIDLIFESPAFRIGILIFLSVSFAAVGVIQLLDFIADSEVHWSGLFFLSFLCSAICFALIFCKSKHQGSRPVEAD